MIYPIETGKAGELARLRTLESVWVQGKLKMWGCWSYIGAGGAGNMFNQLLVNKKITKSALKEMLRHLKKAGLNQSELATYLEELKAGSYRSGLVFCTDSEALLIDQTIARTLESQPGLISILRQRYNGRGMSKTKMAEALNEVYPEWCLRTCKNRINVWLALAEYALYLPLSDALGVNSQRFAG